MGALISNRVSLRSELLFSENVLVLVDGIMGRSECLEPCHARDGIDRDIMMRSRTNGLVHYNNRKISEAELHGKHL